MTGAVLALSLVALGVDSIDHPNVLGITDEMQRFVQSHVDERDGEYERALQLVAAILDRDKLGFTYDRTRSKTAIETFRDASGNCLSFTNLFIALARQIGLDARFQEVEIPPAWNRHGKIVVSSRHVNVVLDIDGQYFEVDLVPDVSRMRLGSHYVSDARGMAHYYSNRGVDFFGKGSPIRARAMFEKAIETDPGASFAWTNLGVTQSLLGEIEAAEQSYLTGIRLDKRNLDGMDNLVHLYVKSGRSKEAERYRKKVARYRNKNPFYHFNLGRLAFDSGNYEESVRHYRAAIKRRSKDSSFYFALAKAYLKLQEFGRSEKNLKQAVRFAADGPSQIRYSEKLKYLSGRSTKSESY